MGITDLSVQEIFRRLIGSSFFPTQNEMDRHNAGRYRATARGFFLVLRAIKTMVPLIRR